MKKLFYILASVLFLSLGACDLELQTNEDYKGTSLDIYQHMTCWEYMEQHSLRQPPCPDGGAGSRRWLDVLLYPKSQRLSQIYLRFVDLLYAARNALAFQ